MKGERGRRAPPVEKKRTKPKQKFLAVYICTMLSHMGIVELKVGISAAVLERVAACRTWNSSILEWHW